MKVGSLAIILRETPINISSEVTCLGMVFDRELKFAIHIRRLDGRCFYHLRQLRSIWQSLNTDATMTLVEEFIRSHVDNTKSVYNGTVVVHLSAMQSVLNASECLLWRSGSATITWLQFEMNCTGYRCNNDLSTNYVTSSTCAFSRVNHRIHNACVFA